MRTGGLNMGDMSKEPSMEEILSSIKRIIAEDAHGAGSARARSDQKSRTDQKHGPKHGHRDLERESHRKAVIATMAGADEEARSPADLSPADLSYTDEILELTEEMPQLGRETGSRETDMGDERNSPMSARPEPAAQASDPDNAAPALHAVVAKDEEDSIVSVASEVAARTSLAALSSMVVKSEKGDGGANTLEDLVREMLRPMLKQWLDSNLPTMVEGMVAKEIARITGRSL